MVYRGGHYNTVRSSKNFFTLIAHFSLFLLVWVLKYPGNKNEREPPLVWWLEKATTAVLLYKPFMARASKGLKLHFPMRRIQKRMSTTFYTPQPKQTHDCSTNSCFGVTNQSGLPQPSHTWLFRSVKEAQKPPPKPPTMRLSIWHSELPESNSRKTQDKNFNPRNAFQNRPTRTLSVWIKFSSPISYKLNLTQLSLAVLPSTIHPFFLVVQNDAVWEKMKCLPALSAMALQAVARNAWYIH